MAVRPRYPHRELSERIAERTTIALDTGCFVWTGALTAAGYGEMRIDGAVELVHRAVYAAERGPVPAGVDIHHVCGRRACCNVEHLEPIAHPAHASHHHRGKPKRKVVT